MKRWLQRRLAGFRSESGTATVEFVIAFPVVFAVFAACLESGLFMTRYVMLDRALDMMVRDLRLGLIPSPTLDKLKTAVCDHTVLLYNCKSALKLELTAVDTANWTFPSTAVGCVDRSAPIQPSVEPPTYGGENQPMLIRACATLDMIFPTTAFGLGMPQDGKGGYYVAATSGFVNEP